MPHIRLEHTQNLDADFAKLVFKQLRTIIIDVTGVKEENCKCKAIYIPIYQTGSDDLKKIIHLEISILKGRSDNVIQQIGKKSLDVLMKYFNKENQDQFSVEIKEINRNNYYTSNII